MIKSALFLLLICSSLYSISQQKEFEGMLSYTMDVKSKVEGVSGNAWRNMLALGDTVNVMVKKGNYRQSNAVSDLFFISKDEKVYFKFQGIDTLYYLNYSMDTSTVIGVVRSEEKKTIAGLECKSVTIRTPHISRRYFYAPSLYMNPEYDKNDKIGRYDQFAKEASSMYLNYYEENESYTITQNCTSVQQSPVEDAIFVLPDLPRKEFTLLAILRSAEFPGKGGWDKYMQTNLNGSLGAKYIKIPKGEKSAIETVQVAFMVNERGRIVNAQVLNKDEVNPHLAEEALRVINASPVWTPANVLGGKCICWLKHEITFQATK